MKENEFYQNYLDTLAGAARVAGVSPEEVDFLTRPERQVEVAVPMSARIWERSKRLRRL